MTANRTVWNSVAVADPNAPQNVIKPNADGSINTKGGGSTDPTAAGYVKIADSSGVPVNYDPNGRAAAASSVPVVLSTEDFAALSLLGTNSVPNATASVGIVPVVTPVAAGSLIAKASGGNLYGLNVKLPSGSAALQIMIFNSATVPADGTVTPIKVFDIPAGGTFEDEFNVPVRCSAGIVIVLSTTGPFTKTIALTTNLGFISADVV